MHGAAKRQRDPDGPHGTPRQVHLVGDGAGGGAEQHLGLGGRGDQQGGPAPPGDGGVNQGSVALPLWAAARPLHGATTNLIMRCLFFRSDNVTEP
jgi:hypothetical protein